eukprot:5641882-Ditylum_brightwellii.AAC.1
MMEIVKYDTTLWGRYLWVSEGLLEYGKTKYRMLVWGYRENRTLHVLKEEELPVNNIKIVGLNTVYKDSNQAKAYK